MRNGCRWLGLLVLVLLASGVQAQMVPSVQEKTKAPPELREVFGVQEAVETRGASTAVRLFRRSIEPAHGLDPSLARRAGLSTGPVVVVAALERFPSEAQWALWSKQGIEFVEYLGSRHWLIEVEDDLSTALGLTGARSFSEFLPTDKISPDLDTYGQRPEFYDSEKNLVVVDVTLRDSDSQTRDLLRESFHRRGETFLDNSGGRVVTLVTEPANLPVLSERKSVLSVTPGLWEKEVLMDGVRAVVNGDEVFGLGQQLLTGDGIRAANNESLGTRWAHEDFMDHDAFGNPTTPRWTPVVEASCLGSGHWHGHMTAGVLMGNGWQSQRNGGEPFSFRGIAPEAIYECYSSTGAAAHLSSHSYVSTSSTTQTHWDAAVVGDSTDEKHHAHVAAGGNSGLTLGYFAMKNNAKNAMIVANSQVNGRIHPTNSSGPTYDGRIKPDIAAPTVNYTSFNDDGWAIEVEWIKLVRNGSMVYMWSFGEDSPQWHQGWGHTDNVGSFGQVFLDATQTATGNLLLDIHPKPWDTHWRRTPLVGTQIIPYSHPLGGGGPLNFPGDEDDVLTVRYRAVLDNPSVPLGYFSMNPIWFRSFAPSSSSDWHSQGMAGGIGIGDGQWRDLEVPVGLAQDIFIYGNSYWPDLESWAGFNIQYLGLRFERTDFQPATAFPQSYGSTGGTSGASPVVGGAYALAMEHHTDLHRDVDLDDKVRRSALFLGAAPPYGMPFNSTWKAIFVHTAKDMKEDSFAAPLVPPNPDTGVPTSYHAGPDYTTGYGMLNIQSGIDLMTLAAKGEDYYHLLEAELEGGQFHTYEVKLPDSYAAGTKGLKVTLVWDDPPAYGSTSQIELKLINNLGLVLEDPNGKMHYPWSIDLPYEYDETNGPDVVEPQPITDADIVPARRDRPNDRDNIEQVQVDDLANNQSGIWKIHVVDNGMGIGDPQLQEYSLVVSPWNVAAQCHDCGFSISGD